MTERTEQSVGAGRGLLPELLLLVLFALIFLLNATSFEIDPYSELFHIVSAKESLAGGRFWTPMLNGHDYLLRAPFWTWVVIVMFKMLGATLWAARLPAVLCALLALILTYTLSMNVTKSRMAALFSATALGTTWGFLQMGSLSTADVLATDLYLLFGWCVVHWHGLATRRHTMPIEMRIFSAAFGVLIGLMLLVKGTLGTLLMIGTGLFYLGITGRLDVLAKLNPVALLAPAIVLPLPWLIWTSVTSKNPMFIMDYLIFQPANRYFGLGAWKGLRLDVLFYFRRLLVGLLPYLFFVPAMFMDREPGAFRKGFNTIQSGLSWMFAWFLLGLVVYSFSHFQEPSMMLPFIPPVAILVGAYLGRSVENTVGTKVFNGTLSGYIIMLMTLAVLMAILIFQVLPSDYVNEFWKGSGKPVIEFLMISDHKIELPEAFPLWKLWLIPGPFILLIGGILVYVLQIMRRMPNAALTLMGTFAIFLLFVKATYLPTVHRPVPLAIAQAINKQVTSHDEIVLYSWHPDVKRVLFYLDADKLDQVTFINKPAQLEKRLAANKGRLYGVIREKSFFTDLDYSYRHMLRVNYFSWKWDMSRLRELRKFMAVRLPLFEKMKSEILYFQSLPGNSMDELKAELLPDPVDNHADAEPSGKN